MKDRETLSENNSEAPDRSGIDLSQNIHYSSTVFTSQIETIPSALQLSHQIYNRQGGVFQPFRPPKSNPNTLNVAPKSYKWKGKTCTTMSELDKSRKSRKK